ncbi:MAG: DivIVA domain-containing protein [Acidimicrobiales bacterium]
MPTDRLHPRHADVPDMSADLIAGRRFAQGWRGYDPEEVTRFLAQVAAQVRALRERCDEAEAARREAEQRASHPDIDEATLMAAVGEETAAILSAARSAAAEITAKAQANAQQVVEAAEAKAAALAAEAEDEVARKSEEAVQEAQSRREQILADLARRRKLASVQIEQLRAGRERLLEAYLVVRRTLDEVSDELQRSDAEAHAAADAVGREHGGGSEDLVDLSAESGGGPPAAGGGGAPKPAGGEDGAPEPPVVLAPKAAQVSRVAQSQAAPGAGREASAQKVAKPPEPPGPGGWGAAGSPATALVARPDAVESVRVLRQGDIPSAPGGTITATGEDEDGAPGEAEPPRPGEGQRDVQGLFARIRAGRAEATTSARRTLREEGEGPESREPLELENDLLGRRDGVTARLESSLARKLKRALQDEQNSLLDRLRSAKGTVMSADVLPSAEEQPDRFVDAGRPSLEEAASAGSQLVENLYGSASGSVQVQGEVVDDLAEELGRAIADPLRERLEAAFRSSGEDPADLAEALGSAYREWKTQRIEAAAGDQVAAAFARGAYTALPEAAFLRWVVAPQEGPCPDCEDNALAGHQRKGQAWPTGQVHPPAHPGCRCLLAPAGEEGGSVTAGAAGANSAP